MLPTKSQKVFIEPDEEIVFTVERILNAKSERLILIIPHSTILTSSAVSMKILASQVAKSDKLIIMVCDDFHATQLAQKSNILVKGKISDIDKDSWVRAKELKDLIITEKNRIRTELLRMRQEQSIEDGPAPIVMTDTVKAVIETEEIDKNAGFEVPVVKPKPRLRGKVVDINGIKIFAGGDIIENDELLKLERSRVGALNNVLLTREKEVNFNEQIMSDNSLVGMDVTDQLSVNEVYKPKVNKPTSKFNQNIKDFFGNVSKVVSPKKLVLFVLGIVAIYVIVSFVFLSSVNISIKFQQNDLTVKKTITAKPDMATYDVATLTIKSDPVTKTNSTSSEFEVTGKGQNGLYALGKMSVFNKSTGTIEIKVGQVFSYEAVSPALKYTAVTAVSVEAGKLKEVDVKAVSFGEKYNIVDKALTTVTVEGLTNTVTGQILTDIIGGTTVEVKALSQEDIDAAKQTLSDKLKNDLTTNLKTLLSENEIVLTGSEKFTEDTFVTSVKLGEVADKFTAELKLTITAIKINKNIIKSLLQDVLKTESGYAQVTVKEPVLENILLTSTTTASFDVKANASAVNDLDLEVLKQEIKNKSVTDTKEYIKAKPGVSEVIIRFNPSFMPLNFQTIPSDDGKITIVKVED
jgi:hypothetical protein